MNVAAISLLALSLLPTREMALIGGFWLLVGWMLHSLFRRGRKGWAWYFISLCLASIGAVGYAVATRQWRLRAPVKKRGAARSYR